MKLSAIRLNQILENKGLTQVELSKITGIPTSTVSDYVTGRTQISKKNEKLIAKKLQIDEKFLTAKDIYESLEQYNAIEPNFLDCYIVFAENSSVLDQTYIEHGDMIYYKQVDTYHPQDLVYALSKRGTMVFCPYCLLREDDELKGKVLYRLGRIKSGVELDNVNK